MNVGLNIATLGTTRNFRTLATNAREAGAAHIEFPIQLWKLSGAEVEDLQGLSVSSTSGLLELSEVIPDSLLTAADRWNFGRRSFAEKLTLARSLGCGAMAVQIDPLSNLPPHDAETLFQERARFCLAAAEAHGIHLLFEYVSHQISRANGDDRANTLCENLSHALDLLARIDAPPKSLLLDIIHWYGDGMSISPGALLSEIGYVHLADHDCTDPTKMSDSHRTLPYSGKLPIGAFVRDLNQAGYAGPASIEMFSQTTEASLQDIRISIKQIVNTR